MAKEEDLVERMAIICRKDIKSLTVTVIELLVKFGALLDISSIFPEKMDHPQP